jgi:flavodoxin
MKTAGAQRSRAILTAVAALPETNVAQDSCEDIGRGKSRILVAYFSRSGNTRVVAGLLQRALNADMFEIRPADPYPEEYLATVEQARQERDSAFQPLLATQVPEMKRYDIVYLGFPIWGETTPPVVRSFLAAHDFFGKTITPFVTHGGYGLGNSLEVLAFYASGAKQRNPFVMEADQERRTMNLVNEWLGETGLSKVSGVR